jgi:Flp pilus assembly protein TadD
MAASGFPRAVPTVPTRPLSIRQRALRMLGVSLLTLSAAGCINQSGGPNVTGSIGPRAGASDAELRQQSEAWGKRYEANPKDRTAALAYGSILRRLQQDAQAVAVLETAVIHSPQDIEILAAYGKSLIGVGRFKQATEVLARAQKPERPDWRIFSAQGSAADQMGDHPTAQKFYEAALKINPSDASVMSNLGLSLALSKRLPEAEATLRRAVQTPGADTRVRQNLALVLGLQGKFNDAEMLVRQDMPPADATANISYIRSVVAQSNSWNTMRSIDNKNPASASTRTKTATTQAGNAFDVMPAPQAAPQPRTATRAGSTRPQLIDPLGVDDPS